MGCTFPMPALPTPACGSVGLGGSENGDRRNAPPGSSHSSGGGSVCFQRLCSVCSAPSANRASQCISHLFVFYLPPWFQQSLRARGRTVIEVPQFLELCHASTQTSAALPLTSHIGA